MIPFTPPRETAGQAGGSVLLDRIMVLIENTFRSLALSVTNSVLTPTTFNAAAFPRGQRVFHGLGQPPKTWEAINVKAPGGVVFESAQPNPNRDKYLILQSTTDVECLIRFN